MEKPLDAFQKWMVKRNLEHAKTEGLETVVARLRAQGYDRVADAVEAAQPDGTAAEINQRIRRAAVACGPWYSDDLATDVWHDLTSFTDENDDRKITVEHVAEYLKTRPKG